MSIKDQPNDAGISADERFRLVVEAAPNAMVLINREGQISMVNAATERLFGYKRSELLGQPVEILVPQNYRGHHADLRLGFFQHAHSSRPMGAGRDLFARHKDGSNIPVEIGLNPIRMDGGIMVLSAIVDISDRAQKLQRLNETLQLRTQELEAVNHELEAFAYSVSHDIRAPLRSMDGFSLALLEDYSDKLDETGKDYLNRIRRGAVRMAQLIDGLLKLSRVTRSTITRQSTDLSLLAGEVIAELRQRDTHRHVVAEIAPNMEAITDPHLIRVVLENLLGNAWKFTGRRPEAHIGFAPGDIDGTPGFTVSDNGAGFDMTYVDKLFAPFQRLHSAKEFDGTGIGLATVARVIRRHGGDVRIQSSPDIGTTITFTLQSNGGADG